MKAIKTNLTTTDGLTVYDLAPAAGDLYAVAGPDGYDPAALAELVADERMPAGFRWIKDEEWSGMTDSLEEISGGEALKILAMLAAGAERNDIAKATRQPLPWVNRVENAWRQLIAHFPTSHGSAHGTGQCSTDPGRRVSDASATDPSAPASR